MCVWGSYHLSVEGIEKSYLQFTWCLKIIFYVWLKSLVLSCAALATDPDRANFVVLVPVPVDITGKLKSEEDAIIVLFNVEDPIPIASWAVRKVREWEDVGS